MKSKLLLFVSILTIGLSFQNCGGNFQVSSSFDSDLFQSENNLMSAFDGNKVENKIYNYAPAIIFKDNKYHIWTCSNESNPGVFRDSIAYFLNGIYQNNAIEIDRNKLNWDGNHVCDPSVVAGDFKFNGVPYKYMMAFLGQDRNDPNNDGILEDSKHNQTGVAFSNNLNGPWVKYPKPIISFDDRYEWGVGQPSMLILNNGFVMFSYTRGEKFKTSAYFKILDFKNVESNLAPKVIVGETEIIKKGLYNPNNSQVVLRNTDFVLNSNGSQLYMLRDGEGRGNYIQVSTIHIMDLINSAGSWEVIANIDKSYTNKIFNHNAGFIRSELGRLINDKELSLYATTDNGEDKNGTRVEWSYKLVNVKVSLLPLTCQWVEKDINFQIGGGKSILPTKSCDRANNGSVETGFYQASSINKKPIDYVCKCQ